MRPNSIFPPSTEDAQRTYKALVEKGRDIRAPHKASWAKTFSYLQGARNFKINFIKGTVQSSYADKNGQLPFVYEDLLSKFTTQKGRLLGLDLSPRVVRKTDSLDGQRAAATAQAVLRNNFPASRIAKLKKNLIPPLLCYGTLGLSLWEDPRDSKRHDIHVLPPWQITPIPTVVSKPGDARGMIIRRKLPIETIRKMFDKSSMKRGALAEAETTSVGRADTPSGNDDASLIGYGSNITTFFDEMETSPTAGSRKEGADRGKTEKMDVAWLGMVYLWDEFDYMTEQLVFVGSKFLLRTSFDLTRTYRTVTTIHDVDAGGFFSRSWMELQIPLNTEIEACLGRQFQNLQDMSVYGRTLVPINMGLKRHAVTTAADGFKYQPYGWDNLTAAKDSVIQLSPFTTGTFPADLIKIGVSLSERVSNQPTALMRGDAPGRVDSAAGLGSLMESSNVPISSTSLAIADGVSEIYRASLGRSMQSYEIQDTIAVTMVDDSLAGVVYNPQTGTIQLDSSGVPHPDDVEITVQSMLPISKQQQIFELKDHLKLQIIDPFEYRIKSRLLNLDLPVGHNDEWENYVKARTENVLLFHDGKTVPEGPEDQVGVLFSREADMHIIHLRIHMELVASIKFSMASPIVRQRILTHIQKHQEDGLGQIPEGMPQMEDAAEETLMFQGAQPGGQAMAG